MPLSLPDTSRLYGIQPVRHPDRQLAQMRIVGVRRRQIEGLGGELAGGLDERFGDRGIEAQQFLVCEPETLSEIVQQEPVFEGLRQRGGLRVGRAGDHAEPQPDRQLGDCVVQVMEVRTSEPFVLLLGGIASSPTVGYATGCPHGCPRRCDKRHRVERRSRVSVVTHGRFRVDETRIQGENL